MEAEIRAATPASLLAASIFVLIGWVRHDAVKVGGSWEAVPGVVRRLVRGGVGPLRPIPVAITTWGWATLLLTMGANMAGSTGGYLLLAATTVCLDGWIPVGIVWPWPQPGHGGATDLPALARGRFPHMTTRMALGEVRTWAGPSQPCREA